MAIRRRKKQPVGYFTTHKARSVWFQQASAFPMRDADPCEVERRMFVDPHAAPQQWEPIGPMNFSGRVTCLAYAPETGMLFAGAAAGGVWRSPDLGKTWLAPTPLLFPAAGNTDPRYTGIKAWPTNNIGALAVDPHNAAHVLCATGEANGSADAYPGCGLFHSLDSGETWHVLAFSEDTGIPRRIGALAIDPGDANHIRIGGLTHTETDPAGLFFSTDGGITWNVENFFNKSYYCHSVAFGDSGALLATIDMRGADNGIWRKTVPADPATPVFWLRLGLSDDPRTGKQITTLPDGLLFGRTSLAVAPSQPRTVYAFAGDRRGRVLGVFRSDDSGDTWRSIGGRHFSAEHQSSYTCCIAVHPEDPDFVVCGGLDLHLSSNGGRTWLHASDDGALPGSPKAVHGDQHAILILKDGTIIAGGDGGVWVSHNRGKSWTPRVEGMQTTMFYAIDVAATNANCLGGGCQDAGTLVRDDRDRPGHFRNTIGGDGAWLVYDREEAGNIFAGYHEAHIFRHHKTALDRWINVNPPIHERERKLRPIVVMVIDPVRRRGRPHKDVYLGTDRLWRTSNWGKTWKPVSPVFDNTPVSAIAIAPHDPRFIMVGTTRGGIFRSTDGAKTWSENFAGAEIPMRLISAIEIFKDPRPPRNVAQPQIAIHALCTVAGTGLGKVPVPRLFRPAAGDELLSQGYSHVFACVGHGEYGWKDVDGGKLPDMAYQTCAFETQPPYRAFIGGDFGVFMLNAGAFEALEDSFNLVNVAIADKFQWVNITGNLPNVIVSDLVYHHDESALYAATYGRGIWRLKLGAGEWRSLGQDAVPINHGIPANPYSSAPQK